MNEYDSEKMRLILESEMGYRPTDNINEALLILLNTCSVRERAENKVFDELGRINILKKNNPAIMVGVGGCVASQEGAAIIKRAPYVDFVFGPQTLHRLPQLIKKHQETGRPQVDISFPEIEKFDALPLPKIDLLSPHKVTAFVSIMEGCSKYCTYCVVPYTRGEEFSRPLPAVLRECAALVAQGVREITLLGQNVNAWRGQMDDGTPLLFADLLYALHEMPDLLRIRYTTSHPLEMNAELIAAHRSLPKLAKHLHLPVQCGSDSVLQAMRRGYTVLEYLSTLRQIRSAVPDISISSDFIVGFPGESADDFQKTLAVVAKANIDQSYSFSYSARPGTPAASLPDTVPESEKNDRLQALQALLNRQATAISSSRVGTVQEVLVEGVSKRNAAELMGRISDNRVVNFVGDSSWIGKMIPLTITLANHYTLRGEYAGK
jgi:tRNA-2-methylthio-N6-dimethylallyladenosine synthase